MRDKLTRVAMRTSLWYAFFASLWIALSGLVLAVLVRDAHVVEVSRSPRDGSSWPSPPSSSTESFADRCGGWKRRQRRGTRRSDSCAKPRRASPPSSDRARRASLSLSSRTDASSTSTLRSCPCWAMTDRRHRPYRARDGGVCLSTGPRELR